VVGVDPSPSGAAALQWALHEAVVTDASVLAVRAWSPNAYAMEAYLYAPPEAEPIEAATAQLEADEQLKLAVEQVPGVDALACTATALLGPAAQVLVAQAADGDADGDMVVVGSRSHGALSRAVLGSVSSSVLHHATGPVTVVPEPRDSDGTSARVVVGVDHSAASLTALAAAVAQARRRGLSLVPVYVHEPIEMPRGGAQAPSLALLEQSERHQLEAAAKAAGASDVEADVRVGHPVVELLRIARPQDLLVVGSRGRGGFAGLLLGSTSTQLAQHAPCPVLVVRA
jgi:nucleotide-binding universal stress UspA family protein